MALRKRKEKLQHSQLDKKFITKQQAKIYKGT
jgi:hypothetical protein